MKKQAQAILARIPLRRKRHWRYISPHRRGAGAAVLALAIVAFVAYLVVPHLANNWTRRQAVRYLGAFTGARVSIAEAEFSLFGDIVLRGVGIHVQRTAGEPGSWIEERFLEAGTIVLRHRPWSLLSDRRLEPTELVCIGPTVTLGYDEQRGRYTAEDLIDAARRYARAGGGGYKGRLPVISIRDVLLRMPGGQTRLNISLTPQERAYRIIIEEERTGDREPAGAEMHLDLATGQIQHVEGSIPGLARADDILPEHYADWRKRYRIRGKVILKGRPAEDPNELLLEAELNDVALTLRPEEGGLDLTGVTGRLVFGGKRRVVADNLQGRVPQGGGATFRMSGSYDRYDANSPFDLTVQVKGLVLPDGARAAGWLAKTLGWLNGAFKPAGRLDIHATCRRGQDGHVELKATAEPKEMAVVCKYFPYPVESIKGTIDFTTERVSWDALAGGSGEAKMTTRGEVSLRDRKRYEVIVSATNVALDERLRAALPSYCVGAWDALRPTGRGDAEVRVRREGADASREVRVELRMDGRCSVSCKAFPLRLDELRGKVGITGRDVTINSVGARRGDARFTIDGTLTGVGRDDAEVDLTVRAHSLSLDSHLIAALPEWTRKPVGSLHATGRAKSVLATFRQSKGGPLDFHVVAEVRDAAMRPDAFAYEVTDANGLLTITRERVRIEALRGRHGACPVQINGQVLFSKKAPGVDLHVQAERIALDKQLHDVLPPTLKHVWRKLSLGGIADVDFTIQHNMPEQQQDPDYRLVLTARGMQVRYEDFPYTLRGLRGRAVATPGKVVLTDMTARHGKATLQINGELTHARAVERAVLSVRGRDVPIDQDLLGAVPGSLGHLARRFRPGGTCNMDLRRLRITRKGPGESAATQPGAAPATRAAARPADWSADGLVTFRDATIDVGLGHKTVSGRVDGKAAQVGPDLAVDARIALERVVVGRQRLTELKGKVIKEPGGTVMRLSELSAKAHGGRVAGFAEVRLDDPLVYGMRLSVEGIKLEDLFAGAVRAAPGAKVKGLLAGTLQLTAATGKKPTRQASGRLRISGGKLDRLPVMLGLMHVVYLSLPGESIFAEGTVTYHLTDDKLVFDEIYLRGAPLSIVGSGVMKMKTEELSMTFLAGAPREMPRIGSLEELLTGIAREIVEVRVSGTVRKPKMQTRPLRSLDRILRDLLNPGG